MKASQFVLTVVLAALVAASVSYGMNRRHDTAARAVAEASETVEVLGVLGLRAEQARALLETRGLLLTIDEEREDARVEAGKICQQMPLDGSRVRRGEAVHVQLARAVATAVVPSVIGRGASKARETLQQAGFTAGKVEYRANEDRGEGTVLEQTPAAGQTVARGSKIDLIVNRLD